MKECTVRSLLILLSFMMAMPTQAMQRKQVSSPSPQVTVLSESEMQNAVENTLSSGKTETVRDGDSVFGAIPWKTLKDIRNAFPKLDIPTGAAYVLLTMALPVRAESDESGSIAGGYINLPIAMIFAREVLEAAVIYSSYRTAVNKSDFVPDIDKKGYIKAINLSAAGGIALGATIATAIGLGTYYGGKDFDSIENGVEIAEGVSKLVAAFFVAHFSVEIPKWLGLGRSHHDQDDANRIQNESGLMSRKMVSANVFWNLLREFGEIGIFLVPAILAGDAVSIPSSGAIGVGIASALGAGYYFGSKWLNKKYLAIGASTLTGLLATGLFSGALHAFEEVGGETPELYDLGETMSDKRLPFALLAPFGYSSEPTALQTAAWWSFAAGLTTIHVVKSYFGVTASQVWKYCRDKVCGVQTVNSSEQSSPTDLEKGTSINESKRDQMEMPAFVSATQ